MNEHIVAYCKEYIENENSPQFAVFLKGEWGCGKTHFINNIIKQYSDKKNEPSHDKPFFIKGLTSKFLHKRENKSSISSGKVLNSKGLRPDQDTTVYKEDIMYLSLFGVSQTSEIGDLIFQKLHPVLASKFFRFSTNIILAFLKNKLDFELDKKEPPIDLYNFETIKVIIVDDLERSELSPSQIFGYFSEHLYQHGIKIIFIGNEDIITKNDNKYREEYLKIKEKSIGIEFLIKPEIEVAIDAFIEELSLIDIKFNNFKDLCMDASKFLECNNLRTIRQCLYNLKILIDSLGTDFISNHINEIARTFINLFIQKSLGLINDKNQIQEAIIGYVKHNVNYEKYEKLKEENKDSMLFNYFSDFIPLRNCWGEIIFDGNYSKEKLSEEYIKENTVNTPAQPRRLFTLLNNWREMNKDDFRQTINDIFKEFQDGSYLHPGEILHFFNIMFMFSHWELIPESDENIKNTVDRMLSIYEDEIIPIEDFELLDMGYGGWGYSNKIPELKVLHSRLKDISYKNRCSQLKEAINNEIKNMQTDVSEFCSNIMHFYGTNKYYKVPILSLIDIEPFFNIFVRLDVSCQQEIVSAFEERYGKLNSYNFEFEEYKLDKDNLKKISILYEASLNEILYNPQELLKRDISKRLQELLDFFDK
jgi:hypothetical protein